MASIGLELAYRSSTGDDRSPALPVLVLRDSVGGLVAFQFFAFLARRFGFAIRTNDIASERGAFAPKPRPDFADVSVDGKRTYYCSICSKDMEIDDDDRCVGCRYAV